MSLLCFKGYTVANMQGKDLSQAVSNREAIAHIKSLYVRGRITREVAEALAEPVIGRINIRQQEIARKHGKRGYPRTSFVALMR
jgi:hypothetical protein